MRTDVLFIPRLKFQTRFLKIYYLPAPTLKSLDKYYDFDELYGQRPNEKDCPSMNRLASKNTAKKADFQLQASKARLAVKCRECNFPRLLYSRKKLLEDDELSISDYLTQVLYVCGVEVPGMYQPKLFDCFDSVSPHNYQLGSKLKNYEPICAYCLSKNPETVPKRKELVCKSCLQKSK